MKKKIRYFTNLTTALLLAIGFMTSCKHISKIGFNTKKKSDELAFEPLDEKAASQLWTKKIDSSLRTTIEHFYQYFWEGNDLWGQFLVAQGDHIIYQNYRGFANLKDSSLITPHTPIHLASISKNLTAMVVLKLVENKKITLQQSVQSVLEAFPYAEITIKDLLTHRSGLGNYDYYAEQFAWIAEDSADFTNKRMYDMYAQCKPALLFKPNSQHSYCNANYAFLALIIEKITQKPYPKAMKDLLFSPLEMNDTYVFQKQNKDTATLSFYYNKRPWKWDKFDNIYGDKNIYSTAQDLFRYSQAMFLEDFLPKSLMDSALQGYSYERHGIKNYGFGFRLREFDNGKKVSFHTGRWHGNNTLFMHLPDEKLTIIALGNRLNRANYSAFSLVSIFGDYPLELEAEDELLTVQDTLAKQKLDCLTFAKKKEFEAQRPLVQNDSVPKKPKPKPQPKPQTTPKEKPKEKNPQIKGYIYEDGYLYEHDSIENLKVIKTLDDE